MEKMNKLEALLEFGTALLKKREINYWLDCGTLLGIIRDKKLLSWEKDIDIGVLREEINESDIDYIVTKAKEHGCEVNIYDFVISIVKNDYVLDFKMYRKKGDILFEEKLTPKNLIGSAIGFFVHSYSSKYSTSRKGLNSLNTLIIRIIQFSSKLMPNFLALQLVKPLKYLYKNFLTIDSSEAVPFSLLNELEQLDFLGKSYNVPKKTEEYLVFRFGQDWKVPKKDWITARDDGGYLLNKNTFYHE
jgi:hypothetical protein